MCLHIINKMGKLKVPPGGGTSLRAKNRLCIYSDLVFLVHRLGEVNLFFFLFVVSYH